MEKLRSQQICDVNQGFHSLKQSKHYCSHVIWGLQTLLGLKSSTFSSHKSSLQQHQMTLISAPVGSSHEENV